MCSSYCLCVPPPTRPSGVTIMTPSRPYSSRATISTATVAAANENTADFSLATTATVYSATSSNVCMCAQRLVYSLALDLLRSYLPPAGTPSSPYLFSANCPDLFGPSPGLPRLPCYSQPGTSCSPRPGGSRSAYCDSTIIT
eukprot:GHVT01039712.1.p1 GENE.GHVT01039712.1~~GHVT01039712.1.p1  ORF type:complete len:142 (+),score=13.70 GHVT01039712.1:725-1150(+)